MNYKTYVEWLGKQGIESAEARSYGDRFPYHRQKKAKPHPKLFGYSRQKVRGLEITFEVGTQKKFSFWKSTIRIAITSKQCAPQKNTSWDWLDCGVKYYNGSSANHQDDVPWWCEMCIKK